MTQNALASAAGVPRPNLSAMECGRREPTLHIVRRLATALEITVGELVDSGPPLREMGRHALDAMTRSAVTGARAGRSRDPRVRWLARLLHPAVASVHPSAAKGPAGNGMRAARYLLAELGQSQRDAVLRRAQKLLASEGGAP